MVTRSLMAEAMMVSERSITRSIKALREVKAIHVVATPGFPNAYIIWPGPGPEGIDTGVQTPETLVSPLDTGVHTQEAENDATLYSLNNTCTFEKSTENFSEKSPTRTYEKNQYPDEFNDLWKIYPRKTNKPGAYKKYQSTLKAGVSHVTLLAAVTAYAQSRLNDDPKFTLHGSTFFGPDERWRDFTDAPVSDPANDEYDALCAKIYDDWDLEGTWLNPDTRETTGQNPVIHGYNRPRGVDNYFVASDGTPYDLNSSGGRVAPGYWN
jgi:hypothetical protein